jgi:hypothetical protein
MKKSRIVILLLAVVIVINACKAREKCPAYGNTNHSSTQKHS